MGYNTPKQTVSQFQLKGRYARQYLSFAREVQQRLPFIFVWPRCV